MIRPRVGLEDAHSLSDVQRFFIIMSPTSREGAPHRLIPIGKKRLPDPTKRERFFGFVQATDKKVNDIPDTSVAKLICSSCIACNGMDCHIAQWHAKCFAEEVVSATLALCFIVEVCLGSQLDNLTAGLEAKEYETKTRGTRRTEAARALGEGISQWRHCIVPFMQSTCRATLHSFFTINRAPRI
jgi:hypothetical protein